MTTNSVPHSHKKRYQKNKLILGVWGHFHIRGSVNLVLAKEKKTRLLSSSVHVVFTPAFFKLTESCKHEVILTDQ